MMVDLFVRIYGVPDKSKTRTQRKWIHGYIECAYVFKIPSMDVVYRRLNDAILCSTIVWHSTNL